MNFDQIATLATVAVVVGILISGRMRADLAALAGAAALALMGVLTPADLQQSFANPALITLASLFIIVHALERTGLVGVLIAGAARVSDHLGRVAGAMIIAVSAALSAFLNNTPIVLLAAPILRDMATGAGRSPKRLLIPLSYASVLCGTCTLIGTSTNLLVDGMSQAANQPAFGLFEITPVGVTIAVAGGLYLLFAARYLLPADDGAVDSIPKAPPTPFRPVGALTSLAIFAAVIGGAFGGAPLATMALAGAVLMLVLQVMSPEEAYSGLRPQILLMIAGMLAVGAAVAKTGLAVQGTEALAAWTAPFGPLAALAALYLATLLLTEIMSNAAVAVLITPLAIGFATNLGVSPRPFIVAVMMAASAAFATPFGYQTNAIVYEIGRYRYIDFLRAGLPLNLITWIVGVWAIPRTFPF